MKNILFYIFLSIVFLNTTNCFAQNDSDSIEKKDKPERLELKFKPRLGLGVGMLTFYGDISNNHSGFHPTVSRIGYDLSVQNELTDFLDIKFYMMWGTVGSNERTLTRNENFQSDITTGGFVFNYNFAHLVNKDRLVNPYIGVGIESVEFLSKTDLYDSERNKYHYWTDGTIKNIAEDDPMAGAAIEIFRDYTYETDLRELNSDGLGDYSERTWGIPVQFGANLHLGERVKFKIGTSMHFTFSDLIDNITADSPGREGTKGNDKFLYTNFALTYDLKIKKKENEIDGEGEILFGPEDCFADEFDEDQDGVADHCDFCHKTLLSQHPVDSVGCPLDSDNDLVPDYKDDEIDSPVDAIVNEKGVALTDDDILLAYQKYMDSTGAYSDFEDDSLGVIMGTTQKIKQPKADTNSTRRLGYAVILGPDTLSVEPNKLASLLDFNKFEIVEENGVKYFMITEIASKEEAEAIMNKLEKEGIIKEGTGEIALIEHSKDPNDKDGYTINIVETDPKNTRIAEYPAGTVFRVQLGAYKNKLSKNVFGDVDDLVVLPGTDGLTRYYSGAYSAPQEAAEHKINMLSEGFSGAFIVAYKDGKRINLSQSGLTPTENNPDNIEIKTEETSNPIRKDLIKFRVQVGAFRNDIPTEILDLYLKVGSVVPKQDQEEGLVKYFIGVYDSYEEANAKKEELKASGLIDAFTVGDFSGRIITAQEAIKFKTQ